mmetsp:Transcript_88447/g.249253  ORF Transcript_88447/g.249253 Transcript_88447/m.249253 type:complete len:327 (-) Transcript_88447:8-988(-)
MLCGVAGAVVDTGTNGEKGANGESGANGDNGALGIKGVGGASGETSSIFSMVCGSIPLAPCIMHMPKLWRADKIFRCVFCSSAWRSAAPVFAARIFSAASLCALIIRSDASSCALTLLARASSNNPSAFERNSASARRRASSFTSSRLVALSSISAVADRLTSSATRASAAARPSASARRKASSFERNSDSARRRASSFASSRLSALSSASRVTACLTSSATRASAAARPPAWARRSCASSRFKLLISTAAQANAFDAAASSPRDLRLRRRGAGAGDALSPSMPAWTSRGALSGCADAFDGLPAGRLSTISALCFVRGILILQTAA